MSAYKDALTIKDGDPDQQLKQAAELLARGTGMVVYEGILALRPAGPIIHCEVVDPMPQTHQCANEYAVMVENVRRRFESSKLSMLLPDLPRKWLVVEDQGSGITEVWHAS